MWFYDISNVTKIRLHSLSLHKNKSRELFLITVEKESVKNNCIFRYANKFEALIAVRVDRKMSQENSQAQGMYINVSKILDYQNIIAPIIVTLLFIVFLKILNACQHWERVLWVLSNMQA